MNRLEVWITDLNSFGVIRPEHLDLLEPSEEVRANEMRQGLDRRRFLLGRILLRKALSAALGGDARQWRFITGNTGKVSLAHHHDFPLTDFSISHSNNAVVIAISTAGRVGLDIEQMNPAVFGSSTLKETLANSLTARELRYLESRSPETRWRQALQIWTIKEAYVKLLGLGVGIDFNEFEVMPSPWRVFHSTGPGGALHLETHEVTIGEESYHLALTARPTEQDVPFAHVRVVDAAALDRDMPEKTEGSSEKIQCGLTSVSWLFSPKHEEVAHA